MAISRRDFIKSGFMGFAAITFSLSNGILDVKALEEASPMTETSFPVLEVTGSPREIGIQIGETFKENLELAFSRREKWFKKIKDYATGDGKDKYNILLEASKTYTPEVVEELEGWAEGSGIAFEDFFALNCKNELLTFRGMENKVQAYVPDCPGCSTVALKDGKSLIVSHNEDGDGAYDDLMFILKAKPDSGNDFMAFTYPGIIEGNAPSLNKHGIMITTNYIGSSIVKPGVPRYFMMRKLIEAKSIDEALEIAQMSDRAYAYHHIITSLKENRAVGIEVSPEKFEVKEIDGLYIHTNHLIYDTMKDCPQFESYINRSSLPRLESLTKNLGSLNISEIMPEVIIEAMSCHEGKPYSVCRHPEGDVTGATLGNALYVSESPVNGDEFTVRLYKNNPCKNKSQMHTL